MHTGRVGQVTGVDAVMWEIEQAVCDALDGLLRATGAVQPPMVHMFSGHHEPAYVGCVTCRRLSPARTPTERWASWVICLAPWRRPGCW